MRGKGCWTEKKTRGAQIRGEEGRELDTPESSRQYRRRGRAQNKRRGRQRKQEVFECLREHFPIRPLAFSFLQ